MLFSVVDDRSGAAYQEYRCVYGEDAESALRFLFNAMAPKPEPDLPFQGIPGGDLHGQRPGHPLAGVPERHGCLGVRVMHHLPRARTAGGRRRGPRARSSARSAP